MGDVRWEEGRQPIGVTTTRRKGEGHPSFWKLVKIDLKEGLDGDLKEGRVGRLMVSNWEVFKEGKRTDLDCLHVLNSGKPYRGT